MKAAVPLLMLNWSMAWIRCHHGTRTDAEVLWTLSLLSGTERRRVVGFDIVRLSEVREWCWTRLPGNWVVAVAKIILDSGSCVGERMFVMEVAHRAGGEGVVGRGNEHVCLAAGSHKSVMKGGKRQVDWLGFIYDRGLVLDLMSVGLGILFVCSERGTWFGLDVVVLVLVLVLLRLGLLLGLCDFRFVHVLGAVSRLRLETQDV